MKVSEAAAMLKKSGVNLPEEVILVSESNRGSLFFNSSQEILEASLPGSDQLTYEVKYDIPGRGEVTEVILHRVTNGLSANYTEPYMRRRDPDTMLIGDSGPTDKRRFEDTYGYPFERLREETIEWLRGQETGIFLCFAGNYPVGAGGVVVTPLNASFFAFGLSLLQKIIAIDQLPADFRVESVVYVAPPFRHTHFSGRQVVVHNRRERLHEMFAYNLYPGPSAKKGFYSVLLDKGEAEGWVTTHCSTVQAVSPYDNVTTFMHEGASGGGKSEMIQHLVREPNGQILIGQNILTGEKRVISIPLFCSFFPATDDMALCHPGYQKNNGKLTVADAENGWFIRVDGVTGYGDDPFLEKITINPQEPLLFLNIETRPEGTALIWNHREDAPGKRCPNPRVIIPRSIVPGVINRPVTVDVRNFGVRMPPCTAQQPTYGIAGLFHVLPPALAWLWRLVSPRGYANPSVTGSGELESEGAGSYWPFATGKRVRHANLLLEQIVNTPRVRYTLTPNQHIGAWKVGFKPQLLMREYLTRRGNAKLRADQLSPARCPLLGYELNYLTIEGSPVPTRFLKVYRQADVGEEGYDAGAAILTEFFRKELSLYLSPDLLPLGRRIINAFMEECTVEEYAQILPMEYQYSFLTINDYGQQ
ncbi:MAG TPA: DUF4914 family protein [Bacteroidales bacterium]|jgi:hypothetical protein|nr:DUF4914 family protein [Bacteroidales bacterium]HOO67041.1 DUF4914 family protein [Bacteroidales bacterium]HPE22771.1 DUF4914 family protein [Bacteroidales bacterium]HPJ04724.1 DUF4914 family protein [Bacteroidales bacterium]HPQ63442.1 DUF4914 family protein [Bacteroidales bacterium]